MLDQVQPVVCDFAKEYVDNLPGRKCLQGNKVALITFGLFAWTCSTHASFSMAGAKATAYLVAQVVQLAVIPLFSGYTDEEGRLDPTTQTFKDITYYVTLLAVMYGLTATIPTLFGVAVISNIIYNFSYDRRGTQNEQTRLVFPLLGVL